MLKSKNKSKNKSFYLKATISFASVAVISLYSLVAMGASNTVGAVNNNFSFAHGTELSIDMTPHGNEDGYHFYSLAPFFSYQNYGLYSGIQTIGNLGDGVDAGNIYIFSVWNATQARSENGSTPTPFGGEGVGYSLRKQYDWVPGNTYTITIKREAMDTNSGGYWWSSTITDRQSDVSLKIGEILSPPGAVTMSGGSAFHERYLGHPVSCSADGHNLERAGVDFTNIRGDKNAGFVYQGTIPNNLFTSEECSSYIHFMSVSTRAVTGFGITQDEFRDIVYPPQPDPDPDPDPDPGPDPDPDPDPDPEPDPNPGSEPGAGTGADNGSGNSTSPPRRPNLRSPSSTTAIKEETGSSETGQNPGTSQTGTDSANDNSTDGEDAEASLDNIDGQEVTDDMLPPGNPPSYLDTMTDEERDNSAAVPSPTKTNSRKAAAAIIAAGSAVSAVFMAGAMMFRR